jgi:hypothetical protein
MLGRQLSVNLGIVEDSSVRVHARQLRLKLHEYFDGEGREEPMIVEIPKGAYNPCLPGEEACGS